MTQYTKLYALLLFFISLSFYPTSIFSQSKNRVGLALAAEKPSSLKVRAAYGISFERLVNKHSSFEIGVYYRTAVNDNLVVEVPYGSNFSISEQFFVLEKFLNIPLLYNYRSNILNISLGPTLDIYMGWKEKKHIAESSAMWVNPLQFYKFDNKLLWGAVAKVSKTIKVSSKVLLEPYIYFNPVFTPYSLYSKSFMENRQYYGAGLSAKYIFEFLK